MCPQKVIEWSEIKRSYRAPNRSLSTYIHISVNSLKNVTTLQQGHHDGISFHAQRAVEHLPVGQGVILVKSLGTFQEQMLSPSGFAR